MAKNKKNSDLEDMVEESNRNIFYATSLTSPEALERAAKNFATVAFIYDSYLHVYRCDCCGHEWYSATRGSDEPPEEIVRCKMGCSDDNGFLLSLYKTISSLISHKKTFGYGRLIKSERIGPSLG